MTIYPIDLNYRGRPQLIAAFVVEGTDGLALVECGPAATAGGCEEGLNALGFGVDDVRHVIVTHVHLDHAGAAGWWAERGATIYVHPKGARHLVDPAKLNAGARTIYGEKLDEWLGELAPVPEDQLVVVNDGDEIAIGDLRFTAWDTPGHARHHHCYALGQVLFAGDLAGTRLPGSDFIGITAAPPQFDPVAYDDSLRKVRDAGFDRLYLTHFGPVDEVTDHLERYRELVQQGSEVVRREFEQGAGTEEIEAAYTRFLRNRSREAGDDEGEWVRHELLNAAAMNADGMVLYWQREKEKAGG